MYLLRYPNFQMRTCKTIICCLHWRRWCRLWWFNKGVFYLAVYDKVSAVLFHGPPNIFYLEHNQERLEKREYDIFEKIVSLALSPGYAGPRFLNSSVCNLRISTKESDVKPTIENLTGFELQQKLKEILRLKDPFAAMLELDDQYNAGIFINIYLGIQFNYIWYNQSLKHGN